MPITTEIEGVACTLEKLPDGRIRVMHASWPVNPMHGPGTDGDVMYLVHPAQTQQYQHLNSLLPPGERATSKEAIENRPWWSYAGGPKETERAEE